MDEAHFFAQCDPLPSQSEMAGFDDATISGRKVVDPQTGEILVGIAAAGALMERAGRTVFDEVFRLFRQEPLVVLCGPGNNGGDGLVLARQALLSGVAVSTFLVLTGGEVSPLVVEKLKKFLDSGGTVTVLGRETETGSLLLSSDITLPIGSLGYLRDRIHDGRSVIIDALLGFRLKGELRGGIREVCEVLRHERPEGKRVVALDVPTGTDCDSGWVAEEAVRAEYTITLEFIKRGTMQYPARHHAGTLIRVPIGIRATGPTEFSLLDESCFSLLAARPGDLHKGGAGHLLVIGGSRRMPGAPLLTGFAGLRSGVGIVTLAVPSSALQGAMPPELMVIPGGGGDHFVVADAELLSRDLRRYSGVAIGPGLGQSPGTGRFLLEMLDALETHDVPVVIDADALNALALEGKRSLPRRAIITPHPGEAGRLLGVSSSDVQRDRYDAAKRLHERTGAVVVLKGAGSIVWSGSKGLVNSSGNPWMATAGSGDVLAGVIGAFLAQGHAPFEAALLGTYFHGRAGDRAHSLHGGPVIASDISESLPHVLGQGFRSRH